MSKRRYAVLAEATVTREIVLMAESPEDAVARARSRPLADWETIIDSEYGTIDTVTERRKGGRAFSVEEDGCCLEAVDDLPW